MAAPLSAAWIFYCAGMQKIDKASLSDHWVALGSPFATSIAGRPVPTDAQLIGEYITNDIVYTCVSWNAAAVAQTPFRLYMTGEPGATATAPFAAKGVSRERLAQFKSNPNFANRIHAGQQVVEITDHPLLDLLERENDGLNGYQLRYITAVYMEVLGGAYWLLEDGLLGPPGGIKVLPTQRVLPMRDRDLGVTGYKYLQALEGAWLTLEKSRVLDFRFPGVDDPYGGRHAPLKSAYLQAQLAAKFSIFQNNLLDNRARVDGIFIPKEQLSRTEAERAEQVFYQKFKGAGNGRVMVAESAGQFVPVAYPPTDLGPLEISRETLRRLCNAFGVPESLVSKDTTYANMQAAMAHYMRHTILPRILIIEQKLNAMLTPLYGPRLFLAAENPVPQDAEFALQRTQVAIGAGVLTPEEIRQSTGFAVAGPPLVNMEQAADAQTEKAAEKAAIFAADSAERLPAVAAVAPDAVVAGADTSPGSAPLGAQQRVGLLLRINRAVARGDLERCVAIELMGHALEIPAHDARALVGHVRQRPAATAMATAALADKPPGTTARQI